MCGIAGIVGFSDKNAAIAKIDRMLEALKHRGPNDVGVDGLDSALFGHRRLSIFDLSAAGHQPMFSDDREIGIAFNGAIYNFLELRKDLEARGCKFRSQTDTEVLIYGYREWGIDALAKKIEGMFAFGLWDNRERKFFLVRDRLGVKPLIYSAQNGELAFASTARALKNAGIGGEIDLTGLAEYLEFGFITDRTSIYKGVQKLEPATILEWQNGEFSTRKYWELNREHDNSITFEDAVEETERLFLAAVEKRLFADVPIGALLSGGIDSSLVCWAIAKLGGDVTAYTVGVPGDVMDETAVAAATAKKIGIKHKVLEMSGDAVEVNELVNAFGEPFACSSALGLMKISQIISSNATVLLTGDGGDDVFLGYPEHKHFLEAQMFAKGVPQFVLSGFKKILDRLPNNGQTKRAKSFFSYINGGLGAVTKVRDGLPYYRENGLLGAALKNIDIPDRHIEEKRGTDLLQDFLKYDRQTRFVGEYLPKVDGATMWHALEARSPFLDTQLWDFASKLPFSVRLRGGTLKAVLREIVKRRIDPQLAQGKKQGFGVPVQRWMTGSRGNDFCEVMQNSILAEHGFIDSNAVLNALDAAKAANWAPRQLWFIWVLETWLRRENA